MQTHNEANVEAGTGTYGLKPCFNYKIERGKETVTRVEGMTTRQTQE